MATTPPPPAALTDDQKSARALLATELAEWDLAAVADWAWNAMLNGTPKAQIMLDLRGRTEYINRFKGMDELRAKGRAITEQEWIEREKAYASQMRAFLPATFYDGPEDFAKLIVGEVSPAELGRRLEKRAAVVGASPQAQRLREQLGRIYSLDDADKLTLAFWINPDVGEDLINRQWQAASAAASAITAGFGELNKDQAERVGAGGYSADFLAGRFAALAEMDEFKQQLPGEGDPALTDDDLIAAGIEGNADAAQKVAKKARTRTAVFEGGGNYAGGQGGVTGIGSAAT